jgi:Arc/MetJ family transcription regulator
MTMDSQRVVKKTLRLDPDKLAKLQKLFETTSESEAVRQAIDETLAYSEALQAARRIQRRGLFARH